MKKVACLAILLLVLGGSAVANDAVGNGALALATLVANQSPNVAAGDKAVLQKLFNGATGVSYPAGQTIAVAANSVRCRASNVAISDHSCDLVFGSATVTITGRRAHELYATLGEVGVEPDGAAGSSFKSLTELSCTIDPALVQENGGGGASCSFTPGP